MDPNGWPHLGAEGNSYTLRRRRLLGEHFDRECVAHGPHFFPDLAPDKPGG
jgi:hypothetical protein